MAGRPDDLGEDVMALVAQARRKAASVPGEGEVAGLVRRAMDNPSGFGTAEISHLGDVATRQAAEIGELLRRLAELVEGERAPGNGTGHEQP